MNGHCRGGSQAVLGGASGAGLIFGRMPSQAPRPDKGMDGRPARATRRPPGSGHETADLIPCGMLCGAIIASSTVLLSHYLNVMDALATVYG
jgi:hypothetical protein